MYTSEYALVEDKAFNRPKENIQIYPVCLKERDTEATRIMSDEDEQLLTTVNESKHFHVRIISPAQSKAILTFEEDDVVLQLNSGEVLYKISYYNIIRWSNRKDKSWAFEYKNTFGECHTIVVIGVDPLLLTNAIIYAIKEIQDLYDT